MPSQLSAMRVQIKTKRFCVNEIKSPLRNRQSFAIVESQDAKSYFICYHVQHEVSRIKTNNVATYILSKRESTTISSLQRMPPNSKEREFS